MLSWAFAPQGLRPQWLLCVFQQYTGRKLMLPNKADAGLSAWISGISWQRLYLISGKISGPKHTLLPLPPPLPCGSYCRKEKLYMRVYKRKGNNRKALGFLQNSDLLSIFCLCLSVFVCIIAWSTRKANLCIRNEINPKLSLEAKMIKSWLVILWI